MSDAITLPRSLPEVQGICSSGILSFIEEIEKNNLELHSFILLRHGYVVSKGWWSPYRSERPHMLFSLSKSFTSTAIGLAVEEGRLSVEDKIISFFPDELHNKIDENLDKLCIKHLLSMSTGHAKDTSEYVFNTKDGNWIKAFLELPIDYEPGTHFVYNTATTYMLSAILQKTTGENLLNYITPRLLEPLGIERASWEVCPRGINTGGFGLSIKTEDIAKFGQLYLQKGVWNGKSILTERWVEEATSSHISNGTEIESDWSQGYCYQFWRCRNVAYRGDGAFGQYCIVMPKQDAVIAITSSLDDMQIVLNLIWKHLLPSIKTEALNENPSLQKVLIQKLSTLEIFPPKLLKLDDPSTKQYNKHYKMNENEFDIHSVSFKFHDNSCLLKICKSHNELEINCGIENWLEGTISLSEGTSSIATSGTWCN